MTAAIIQAHYVIAGSSELAVLLAENMAAGRIPSMASSATEACRLADLHPLGYRPSQMPFLVYTGLETPRFKLLETPIETARHQLDAAWTGEKP